MVKAGYFKSFLNDNGMAISSLQVLSFFCYTGYSCCCCCCSLVPGQRLAEKVCEGRREVLLADGPHAAEGARAGLRVDHTPQLLLETVNDVRDLEGGGGEDCFQQM